MAAALLIAGAVLLLGAAALVMVRQFAADKLEQRVIGVVGIDPAAAPKPDAVPFGLFGRFLEGLGQRVRTKSKLYSEQDMLSIEGMIAATGLNATRVLPMVLGAKVLFTVAVPVLIVAYGVLAGMPGRQFLLLLSLGVPVGLLGPDWILYFVRRPYAAALRRGLPDALDLLVICTESGMALETALEQVAHDIAASNPSISVALSKLLDELRVLPDRRAAFENFGRRSGIDGFRRLAAMLGQTLQFGTPIAEALRAVAFELRRERMVAMEGRCAKLPALLVLPLILFIMPALFIVLAASPVLRVLDTLRNMGHGLH